jgi:hypothetical protein
MSAIKPLILGDNEHGALLGASFLIGYAKVVDRMAWTKLKKTRSSSPSVAHEPNDVHVTVSPVDNAEINSTDRDQSVRAANGVSRTMLDGFVPGARVAAASSDTPATVDSYDSGRVPDDPGDLGIEALFSPEVPGDEAGTPDAASTDDQNADGQDTGDAGVLAAAENTPEAGADGAGAPGPDDAQGPDAQGPGAWAGPEAGAPVAPGVPGADTAAPPGSGIVEEQPGTPRERLRDFVQDSRMRIWRRRILLTVIAGAVFSIIFTWRLGLTIAVIVAIADTVWRSRTMASVPPGVKVTQAQRKTQRQLARLERSGYRALHSRPIPGSKEFIDHLVIGPTGVYAIDSEKWDRRLPIRTRNARQLWHGPESKKDRLEHAKWEAERASTLLSGNLREEIIVRPTMAIYGPKIPWDIATIRDVDVYSGPRVRKYLRKRGKMTPDRLPDAEVEKIYRAAMTVLPF